MLCCVPLVCRLCYCIDTNMRARRSKFNCFIKKIYTTLDKMLKSIKLFHFDNKQTNKWSRLSSCSYLGDDSLLHSVATCNGFFVAVNIATTSLKCASSCHVQISGAHLASVLLTKKQMPLPFPLEVILQMILLTDEHLAQHPKK